MDLQADQVTINGVEYVRKGAEIQAADLLDGKPYMIVRTYSAGVFAGYMLHRDGQEVEMTKARRLWQWSGAASLSQMAVEGVKNPDGCKFAMECDVLLLQVIEILPCTKAAQCNIQGVAIWKN